jgi:hypothetical protein
MAWQYCALVVANVTGSSPELIQALKERAAQGDCRFTMIVPATGGGSAGREEARTRLGRALEIMREEGLEVEGQIGDPDPVAAVTDLWDPTKFDEVIVSTLPTGTSRWLAIDLPHRLGKLTGVEVRHVVAQPPRKPPKTEPAPERPPQYGVLAPFAALAPRARGAASRALRAGRRVGRR